MRVDGGALGAVGGDGVAVIEVAALQMGGLDPVGVVTVLVCLGQFLVVFSLTSLNIALPSLAADLGMDESTRVYVISAYGIALGSLLLLGGRMGDLLGRRKLFLTGTAIFAAGAVVCLLAPGTAVLLTGRVVQGIGAAMLAPAALATINAVFAEGPERNQALGTFGAVSAAGGGLGIITGGILTDLLSWEWVFAIKLPIAMALLLLVPRVVPETRDRTHHSTFDVPGALTSVAALGALVVALTQAERWGFTDARTLGLTAAALVLGVAFVVIERRQTDPLVPLRILRRRHLASANAATALLWAGFGSTFLFIALFAQQILGYSPLETGLAFLAIPVAAGIASTPAERASNGRFGAKPPMLIGLTSLLAGLILLTGADADTSYAPRLLAALVLFGIGISTTLVALNITVFVGSSGNESGVESGLLNTSQEVGAALGVSVLTTVFADRLSGAAGTDPGALAAAAIDGYQAVFAVAAGIILATLLIAAVAVPGRTNARAADTDAHADAEPAVPVARERARLGAGRPAGPEVAARRASARPDGDGQRSER